MSQGATKGNRYIVVNVCDCMGKHSLFCYILSLQCDIVFGRRLFYQHLLITVLCCFLLLSGIVHAGFDDKPGSIRSKYCWPGNQMFRKLDEDLHFGYQVNGSLVVAFTPQDIEHLEVLKKRGETNGVQNLRIVHTPELHEMEPHLHPKAVAALLAPDAGRCIITYYVILKQIIHSFNVLIAPFTAS